MINKGIVLGVLSLVVLGAGAYSMNVFAAQNEARKGTGVGATSGVRQGAGQGLGQGQCTGEHGSCPMRGQQRGENKGGNFVDANGDGVCDHMQK